MSIIAILLIGLVAGVLAKLVMPGSQGGGILATIALGLLGAVVAGLVGHAVGWYGAGDGPGLIASAVGAVGVLAVYGWATRTA